MLKAGRQEARRRGEEADSGEMRDLTLGYLSGPRDPDWGMHSEARRETKARDDQGPRGYSVARGALCYHTGGWGLKESQCLKWRGARSGGDGPR
jgi:hypothetical protein